MKIISVVKIIKINDKNNQFFQIRTWIVSHLEINPIVGGNPINETNLNMKNIIISFLLLINESWLINKILNLFRNKIKIIEENE